jgi:phage terminase Nu1 subunit (DNA packaging protein)
MDVRDILTPECDLDVENMFELEAEIITLQEKVTTLEDKLSRANDAKNFCLARAQKHQIEYKTHVNEIETRHYEATTLAQSRHAETVQNMVQQLDEMRRRIKDLESTEAKKIEYIKFQDATIKSLKLRLRARGKPAGKIGQNHIEPNGPRKRKRENSST